MMFILLGMGSHMVTLAVAACWVGFNYGGNWTALFCTGEKVPVPPQLEAEGIYLFPGRILPTNGAQPMAVNHVVAVDLNDAPAGGTKDQMPDNRRELPCATGMIPVDVFLQALNQIGYDGPVRVEPFNQKVGSMSKDEACAAAAASLKKAFALVVF